MNDNNDPSVDDNFFDAFRTWNSETLGCYDTDPAQLVETGGQSLNFYTVDPGYVYFSLITLVLKYFIRLPLVILFNPSPLTL